MSRSNAIKAVDPSHLAFLADLPILHLERDILCVHAGVKPNVPLDRQDPQTLLTIRGRFLRNLTTCLILSCTAIRRPAACQNCREIGSISTLVRSTQAS